MPRFHRLLALTAISICSLGAFGCHSRVAPAVTQDAQDSTDGPSVSQPEPSVPFSIRGDDGSTTVTSFASLIPAPVNDQFVTIRDSHFFVGDQRLRFWGVNLCFGACFPTHEEAAKIAPHFAKLGINAVRFHHMDMLDAPEGIWKTESNGQRVLSPEQIDRLDFFLNELHRNGIYANINLHVSRTLTEGEGYPVMKNGLWWAASNKWVMYYDPDVQNELKEYCRELLTHENPYRKLKRVDDPGIAVLEMLNENYFSVKGTELLGYLPERFVKSFNIKWNSWLTSRYTDTEAMQAAWDQENIALGDSLLPAVDWKTSLGKWVTNLPNNDQPIFDRAGPSTDAPAVRFEPKEKSDQAHQQQLLLQELSVKAGEPYTFSFWARADQSREFNYEVSTQSGGEWRPLGVFETGKVGPEWTEFRRIIFPAESIDGAAYIAFSFGTDQIPIEFADIRFNIGAEALPLPAGQSLEKQNIGVPASGWPLAAHRDLKSFLVDTEREWIVNLKSFLTDELGVKVPITASQENYHAPGLLAETVDFVDFHNYWHHPTFPAGKDFNPTEYRTGNDPMEAEPTRSGWPANSLLMRTGWRYHGMPFTLSEWNHAEPSDVSTGAVMMAAALGATQDWDGIFFFNYGSDSRSWFREHFQGFFDFNGQPAKLATLSIASNIYLRGDLKPIESIKRGTLDDRLDGRLAFDHRIGVDPKAATKDDLPTPETLRFETPTKSLVWDATNTATGHLQIDTPNTQGAWGLVAEQSFELSSLQLVIGPVARNYATLIATSKDDLPLQNSKSIVLLASSGAENTGMQWNEDRTSVGDQWGSGPTLINPVPATVRLVSSQKAALKVFALDGSGQRTVPVPTTITDDGIEFEISGKYGTLWYEISGQ